jgi:hypothetical protein
VTAAGGAKARATLVLAAALLLGAGLRLHRLASLPPGPWIDEMYFLRASRVAPGGLLELGGTTPMQPVDFVDSSGFRYYPSNLFLALVSALDRLAGGGMPTARLVSAVLALAVLLSGLWLAREATRGRAHALAVAAILLATSMWLLTQGRWAWDCLATTAAASAALALALRASHRGSPGLALASGACLGLAPYGHTSGRLVFLVPAAVVAWALATRRTREARLAALVLAAALAVATPLAVHWARHPERFVAHVGDVSILARGAARAPAALARNLGDYAALFFVRGDPLVRHGDPSRPIVWSGIGVLMLAGAAASVRVRGPERLLALGAATFLLGGLLARDTEGANASRVSAAAPLLLVLAALGFAALLERVPAVRRRLAAAALWAVVGVSSALDVAGFLAWGASPRLEQVFGGRERRLADALAAETRRAPADVLLHPRAAARNVYLVDVLLGRPGDGARHAVRVGTPGLETSWLFVPARDVLYATGVDRATRSAVEGLGGRLVAEDTSTAGAEPWALYRIPRSAAAARAGAALASFPRVAAAHGAFEAAEDGLYVLSARGGVVVTLGGRLVLSSGPDPASAVLNLAKGRHPLDVRMAPGGTLRITGPDGFVLPGPAAEDERPGAARASASAFSNARGVSSGPSWPAPGRT